MAKPLVRRWEEREGTLFSLSLCDVFIGEINEKITGQQVCVSLWGKEPRKYVFLTTIPGNSDEGGPETIC